MRWPIPPNKYFIHPWSNTVDIWINLWFLVMQRKGSAKRSLLFRRRRISTDHPRLNTLPWCYWVNQPIKFQRFQITNPTRFWKKTQFTGTFLVDCCRILYFFDKRYKGCEREWERDSLGIWENPKFKRVEPRAKPTAFIKNNPIWETPCP